jgi:hypothetical protein
MEASKFFLHCIAMQLAYANPVAEAARHLEEEK